VTVVSTYYYSNPATKYLTETNSVGVITGMPGQSTIVTGQPHAVTSQPAVATIPAGLPTGFDTITINGTAGLTSFTIDVASSTTRVLGAPNVKTGTAGASSFVPAGQSGTQGGNGPHHKPTGTAGGNNQGTASSSASASSSSGGAASNVKVASAGMLGLGALFAAIL
jgi:hypothetical protein